MPFEGLKETALSNKFATICYNLLSTPKIFILDALRSVINQTYKKIEVIIIFDDENNEDYEYIKKYIKKDKRISIYKNNIRLGAVESRNKGIKIQYIDDVILVHHK